MRYIHSEQRIAHKALLAQFAGDEHARQLRQITARFKIHMSASTKSSCDLRSAIEGVNNKPMNLNGVRQARPNTITVQHDAIHNQVQHRLSGV